MWSQGRIIAESGEGYGSKAYAEWMGARVCDSATYSHHLTNEQVEAAYSQPPSYLLDGGK